MVHEYGYSKHWLQKGAWVQNYIIRTIAAKRVLLGIQPEAAKSDVLGLSCQSLHFAVRFFKTKQEVVL